MVPTDGSHGTGTISKHGSKGGHGRQSPEGDTGQSIEEVSVCVCARTRGGGAWVLMRHPAVACEFYNHRCSNDGDLLIFRPKTDEGSWEDYNV